MSYNLRKATIEKQNHLKEIPEEELDRMRQILNDYIAKNRKKHVIILKRRLYRVNGSTMTNDVVEDILQNIYIYAWTNIERVMEFYKTDNMDRYFLALFYNQSTAKNARLRAGRDLHFEEIWEEYLEYEEDDPQYSNYALNPRIPTEERIHYHKVALQETKDFLWDNTDCDLNKALLIQKSRYGQKGYDVAINYIATPSYSFLMKNCRELGIHNVQTHINHFKEICADIYGKKIVHQAEVPFIRYY